MDISYVLRQATMSTPRVAADRPALLLEDDASLSLAELDEQVTRLAGGLLANGIKRGDRVGVLLFNCLEYWLTYFALTRIGAVAVRANFRLTGSELEFLLTDSGCTAVIGHGEIIERITDRDGTEVGDWFVVGEPSPDCQPFARLQEGPDLPADHPLPEPDEQAMIMYTSGTTGRPKGAVWTHGATTTFCAMQIVEFGFSASSVTLVPGPLYHVGALEDYALPSILVGGQALFLHSKNFDIMRTLRLCEQFRVTDLVLFPTMIYQMLQSEETASIDLSSVRRIFTGGDPMLPWAVQQLQARYGWMDLVQVYGLTEGTPIAACTAPGMAFAAPERVGRAIFFGEISIRDDDGVELPPGADGEIWTRSPANSRGYWNRPEVNQETFVDGWCKTGDLGSIVNGSLAVTGRKKDMVRSGGENIYPREIEDVLMRHPAVLDASVIGVPDPVFLETVCAVIVPRPDVEVSAADIVDYCLQHLASYKKPKYVEFVTELPRTASHKTQKFALRERFASLGAPSPNLD